ncbi:MAG TPA: hypothetical protein VGK87_07110 [Anaerolineae bacterium]
MSENTARETKDQGASNRSELVAELNRLGENLGKLLKASWESDERHSVERELKSGLEQLNKQINNAVEQARSDQHIQKARVSIKEAWHTAHGPQVVTEMRMGLIDSLKKLNDEIVRKADAKATPEVKDVPTSDDKGAPDAQNPTSDALKPD